jgi:Fe-S-cluster containining protein
MYQSFGIIYLASLHEITINVWPEEKELLEAEAKKRGISINIRPKRAVYNPKSNELVILDYFIDHDICPFFDSSHKTCTVYDIRPLICRSYPLLTTQTMGKCRYKKLDFNAYGSEIDEAKKLEERVRKQKAIIKNMIDSGEILIQENITIEEIDRILKNAKYVELRI